MLADPRPGSITGFSIARLRRARLPPLVEVGYTPSFTHMRLLGEGHLGSPYSLSEARVLYDLAHLSRDEVEVTELRKRLGLDAGYASRLLAKLAERDLVIRQRSSEDARRQVIRLTEAGKTEQRALEDRTVDRIATLLEPLDEEQQRRLLISMRTISDLVGGRGPDGTLVLRPARPGDLGWMVQRHADLYAREYGWGLWTHEVLAAARKIYRRAGFELVESKRHTDFGKEEVSEIWHREL